MRTISFLCVIGWLGTCSAGAAQFYVSLKGNDTSDGKSESTAWRTAGKVNSTKFDPGDSILFERGGEWHEQLIASSDGTAAGPITYADFGDPKSAKPVFWGSDVIPLNVFTPAGDSVYTFAVSALPTGKAYGVFADHEFLATAANSSKMPANSFCISGSAGYINTGGVDPRGGKVVYTATDRAQGTNADSSLICSNGHSYLVFNNLVGKETAGSANPSGVPDGYVYRIQGSSNVLMNNCEAYNGGKHHVGVINSTGFVGKNIYASGCMPGLPYGNAGAFVSFSDDSRHGDTSQWIDCKVEHFDPAQQSFITHGAGLGYLLIQNLTSIGCGLGIGTDGPGEKVIIKGGYLAGPTCDIYGTHVIVDGLKLGADAKIDLFGNENTVQNCVDQQSTNNQGGIVVRGKTNVIRFNTLAHKSASGPCIDIKSTANDTRIIGNLFTAGATPVNDEGAAGLVLDYNWFDNTGGPPGGLDKDAHLVTGDPHFADASAGSYALGAGSAMIGKVPAAAAQDLSDDFAGNARAAAGPFDIGAFQSPSPK